MADIESGAIDTARLAAVAAAVGAQRLHELMLVLGQRVESLAASAEVFPEAAEDCLAALHQSRGSAASLGFMALAEGLARMEALARQGQDAAAVREAGRALHWLWRESKEGLLF
jgi:HPt (histidine-containing phosphotransfer) domain-containing protein